MIHWRRVLPKGLMLEVQYEDVVADLKAQARRLVAGSNGTTRVSPFTRPSAPCARRASRRCANRSTAARSGGWEGYEDLLPPFVDALDTAPAGHGSLGSTEEWKEIQHPAKIPRRGTVGWRIINRARTPPVAACSGESLRLLRRHLAHFLTVETDKVHRIQHERRIPPVAHGCRDDLPRERKQQSWAFNHHDRMYVFLSNVLDPEYAGIDQLEGEQHLPTRLRFAVELELDFDVVFGQRGGV